MGKWLMVTRVWHWYWFTQGFQVMGHEVMGTVPNLGTCENCSLNHGVSGFDGVATYLVGA